MVARRRRQRKLADNRLRRAVLGTGALGWVVLLLVATMMNGAAAYAVAGAMRVGQEYQAKRHGVLLAHGWFIDQVADAEAVGKGLGTWPGDMDIALRDAFDREAVLLAGTDLDRRRAVRRDLRNAVQRGGAAALTPREARCRAWPAG